jgi:hypothetical protein
LEPDVIADGLHLALIRARADHEEVGERSDRGEIENPYIGSFLRFGGSDGQEPGRGCHFHFRGRNRFSLQNTLL